MWSTSGCTQAGDADTDRHSAGNEEDSGDSAFRCTGRSAFHSGVGDIIPAGCVSGTTQRKMSVWRSRLISQRSRCYYLGVAYSSGWAVPVQPPD